MLINLDATDARIIATSVGSSAKSRRSCLGGSQCSPLVRALPHPSAGRGRSEQGVTDTRSSCTYRTHSSRKRWHGKRRLITSFLQPLHAVNGYVIGSGKLGILTVFPWCSTDSKFVTSQIIQGRSFLITALKN